MLCARPTGDRHRRKKRDGAMSNFDQDQGTRLPSFKYMYSTVLPLCSTLIPICRKNDCVSHIHPPDKGRRSNGSVVLAALLAEPSLSLTVL